MWLAVPGRAGGGGAGVRPARTCARRPRPGRAADPAKGEAWPGSANTPPDTAMGAAPARARDPAGRTTGEGATF